MLKQIFILITISLALTLASCSGRLFTVHKIDVQQGNAIDPEKVEQLKLGMNREQVKFLMGSPLITDTFHPDRWDYVYHLIPDYGDITQYHVAIHFEGDQVANIEKNNVPEPTPEEIPNSDSDPESDSESESSP